MSNFEPRQRTSTDGKTWWVVFNLIKMQYSTLICFGKYKTKKACQQDINFFQNKLNL